MLSAVSVVRFGFLGAKHLCAKKRRHNREPLCAETQSHLIANRGFDMNKLFAVILLAGAFTLGCSGNTKANPNNSGGGNGPSGQLKASRSQRIQEPGNWLG